MPTNERHHVGTATAARDPSATHAGSETYQFTRWQDCTAPLPQLNQQYRLTKLYLSKNYGFLDEAAQQHHDDSFSDFQYRTPWDVHQSFDRDLGIAGFKSRTLCCIDDDGPPSWVNLPLYLLVSITTLSIFFRMALDNIKVTKKHGVLKRIEQ
jgi:hypothetical protein